MAEWQRARLIPVSGISSEKEAEARATSALLAVIEAVRDLSTELFTPIGATRARRAEVASFIEVPYRVGSGRAAHRPDGLVRIDYRGSSWSALIEVKTGAANLTPEQVNAYWDIARENSIDAVVTISNEMAASPDAHPTAGLKVRSNSRVKVHHYSWAAILTKCEVIKEHRGVDDPDQAWILGELIRYLRHPNSGASGFTDMGPNWVAVRNGAHENSLRRTDPAVREVVNRWDQLLRFAALRLEADIGETVMQRLPSSQRDPAKRQQHLVDELTRSGQLDGALRIPNTAGDLELLVDVRARRITASVSISAPDDRGGRARCTWLAKQLDGEVDGRLQIEAFARNARTATTTTLSAFREDTNVFLGEDGRDPTRFRLSLSREMGQGRGVGKGSGFIESVLNLITDFYGSVVQDLTPWNPPAPKITRTAPAPEPDTLPTKRRDDVPPAAPIEPPPGPLPMADQAGTPDDGVTTGDAGEARDEEPTTGEGPADGEE